MVCSPTMPWTVLLIATICVAAAPRGEYPAPAPREHPTDSVLARREGSSEPPPNVVFILCDNLGYGDIGCYGSTRHRTPHVDRLAEQGMRLTDYYSTSGVCTPSRASLLTGCYPIRVGMHVSDTGGAVLQPVARRGLNPAEETVAELLQSRGYTTALVGKWHLGDQPRFLPTRHGFDEYLGIPYSDDMTPREGRPWPPLPLMRGDRVIEAPVDRNTLTARYTDETIRFITANRDRPFFVLLSHAMPGSTLEPFSSDRFRGKSPHGAWADSVEEIDWSTGEIMQSLERLGLDRRTIVVWTSDNGAPRRQPPQGSNLPLAGWGYTTDEGGMRVPCIVRWPGRVPAGSTSSELLTMMDWLPTLARIAGARLPHRPIDGHDIRPILTGGADARSPYDAFFYYHLDQLQAVRSGPWKLYLPLERKRGLGRDAGAVPVRLVDLAADLDEKNNLATDRPDVVERLTELAARARVELGDGPNLGRDTREAGDEPNPTARVLGCLFVPLGASHATAHEPRMPLLMPDDFSDLHLVTWRVEPGTPDPNNPLIEGEMPWDRGGVGIHGSVFRDPIAQRWRAYLVCTPAEEFPEKQPENQGKPWASENHAHRRVCLFESPDGVHWTRANLSNVPFGDHKTTNIIFDVTDGVSAYSSILLDPRNKEWPYEMFVLRESWGAVRGRPPEGNGYYRYRSRDGRAWERVGGKVTGPMTGDLCFFYRTPGSPPGDVATAGSDYVAYYRLGGPRSPTDHLPVYEDFPRRSCFRAHSQDGAAWTKDPAMLLTADERDHRDTQYQECVPLRVPGGYIGMITMYHPLTQTLDLRMAASRDGRSWWFPDRRPCLPNAPIGDYGGGMIWQTQYPIVDGDALHIYYGGTEGAHRQIHDTRSPSKWIAPLESVIDHGAHFLPFNSALCRASWRVDRLYALASAAGGPTIGVATTKSQELGGRRLALNLVTRPAKRAAQAGVDEGFIHVELLDESGNVIAGFAREDCTPLRGDHKSIDVTWKGGDRAPAAARQVRFYLKRAFLYGFQVSQPQANTANSRTGDQGDARPRNPSGSKVQMRPYVWQGPYSEMRAQYATPHDVGLCADVRAPWMADGERIILRACEIIGFDGDYLYDDHFPTQELTGRGKHYRHVSYAWNELRSSRLRRPAEPEGGRGKPADPLELLRATKPAVHLESYPKLTAQGEVPHTGRFRIELEAHDDSIDISLTVRNDRAEPVRFADWYFCVVGFESPTIGDATLERTWVVDGDKLRSLAELSGVGKGEEMFAVAGPRGSDGFIPPLHATHPRGSVQPRAPVVLVEDVFGTHTVALAFERAHSIFSSTGNRCFHADPFFGLELGPGEERRVRGRLYLMKGSAKQAWQRIQGAFRSAGSSYLP